MASIVKRGKNYHVRVSWRDKSGVLKQKSKGGFKTKNEARQYAVELEQQLFTGVNIKQKKIPFSEYFAIFQKLLKLLLSFCSLPVYDVVSLPLPIPFQKV